jgi:hypothetical protein
VPWKLTVRSGPKVETNRFNDLGDALDALERRGRELSDGAPAEAVDVKVKRYDPVQQVSARIELSGPQRLLPKVHAGVDIRGDGSTEPYRGRINREIVEQRKGESPYQALRRILPAD